MDQSDNDQGKMVKTDQQWQEELTEEQYRVLRKKGTEAPFTGKYYDFSERGTYKCAACGNPVFTSGEKFYSACGWPAFSKPASESALEESSDTSHGMIRTEITCSKCGSHLGHVFNDGPPPTNLRYCINSVSLEFEPESE